MSKTKLFCSAAVASCLILVGQGAHAQAQAQAPTQTSPTDEGVGTLREIVVTARRTTENLQTTPVAVTALDNQTLEQHQIAQVSDLQRATPSLTIGGAGTGPSSIVYMAIRGNAQNSPNSASDAAVGIYVDGVYYGRPIIGNLGLLDLSSAEVLRGTQGTLFGRNTTGGALNLTTTQPSGTFTGYATAGLGNFNSHLIESAATVPIKGDEIAVRLAGRWDNRDGYGENPITGRDIGKVDHDWALRGTLRFAPENLPVMFTLSGDYLNERDQGTMAALKAYNPTGPLALFYPGQFSPAYVQTHDNFWTSYGNPRSGDKDIDQPFNKNDSKGVLGNLQIDLGDIRIRSISAYRRSSTANSVDLDNTPAQVGAFVSYYRQEQGSEELQVSGKYGKLDWIGGLFYFQESGTEISDSFILENATLAPGFTVNLQPSNRNDSDFKSTSKAVFGQVNYHFTDRLRATAGYRYTWDERNIDRHGVLNISGRPEVFFTFTPAPTPHVVLPLTCNVGVNKGLVNPAGGCDDPHSAKFNYPAWLLSLDYQWTDNVFVYAKTGGAAMAGGFNTRPVPPGLDAFRPEKVRDVEAGLKGDFLDRRLRTNAAIFYNWRNGAQNIVNEFSAATGLTQYVRNAGNVHAYGVEFEGTYLPWRGMELTAALSRLHAEYESGSFKIQGVGGPVDRSGEAVPQAPKWSVSLSGTQTQETSWGHIDYHLDYAYISSRNYGQDTPDLTNPALTAAQRAALVANYNISNYLSTLKGYGLLNARLTFALRQPNVELALWGRNLGNTKYNQNLFNSWTGLGFVEQYQGDPRTYGVTATYRW